MKLKNQLRKCLFVALALGVSITSFASTKIGDLYYDLNSSAMTASLTYESTSSSNYSSLPAEVVIPSTVTYNGISFTVTTISDKAFADCTSLESITIPGTVTEVGTTKEDSSSPYNDYLPFYNCTSLKHVIFEDGSEPLYLGASSYRFSRDEQGYGLFSSCPLEEVYIGRNIKYKDYDWSYTFASYPERYGYSAFYNQAKLAKVTIGANVSTIQQYAFYKCGALTTVEFGNSLTEIPKYAFDCCKLTSINLPNTVKTIGFSAFGSNSTLTTANIGNEVTDINAYAFYGCSALSNIVLPETLKTIGYNAFENSGLESVTIPNSVTTIGSHCFYNCKKIVSASVGSGCATLPENMFAGCSLLSNVTLVDGLTTISDKAFADCTSLESITIPGTVTEVGTTKEDSSSPYNDYLPFYNCTSLKHVIFEDGSEPLYLGASSYRFSRDEQGYGLFSSCPLEEVYIGRNIKYKDYDWPYTFASYPERYGYSAFYNQAKLAKVTIGEGCTELTDYLFYKNAAITLLNLPNVKKIGKSTFQECAKLATLNLGSSIETVGNSAFYNCSNITKLTFPNSAKNIGNSAFYNCTSIAEVTVGSGLETIGSYAFYNCKSFTALILPNGFKTMGESAFEECIKLTIAKLGQSLTSVPAKAFKNCISLSEMVIPGTAEFIGDQAFYNDSTIATITMNEGLKTIGSEVFYNNSGIMRFTIPGTVTSIGANSFYGCTNVTYLIFKEGEGTLNINNSNCRSSKIDALTTNTTYRDRKYDYFYDCPIRFLTIGKDLTYSNYSASVSIYNPETKNNETRASAPFVNNTNIRSVTIGSNVTLLYHHLLNGCSSITKLTMPSSMKRIYSYALANCTGITSLTLPNPLILLGDYACENNTNLASITLNEEEGNTLSLTIGVYALSNCPALTKLTFPAKTKSIGDGCFYNDTLLVDITFVDSDKSVNLGRSSKTTNYLFGDCKLQKLYMGRNIDYDTSSGNSPFRNQTTLTDIKFSQAGTVTYCKDYLLYGASSCETLDLPESITELGKYTFAYMTKLDGVNIPSKVSWLKAGLFSNDKSLSSIIIHPAVVKMDSYIFASCSSLSSATFEGNTELLEMGYGASYTDDGLFRDCPLETLNLDRWLSYNTEKASRSPFYSISTLKNLNIGENVKVIDKYMFSYCSALEEVYLPDNIESVGLWGFRGCTSLKSVRFSDNLSQIADYGFSECSSLDNVVFPESMTSIADNSFSNCTSLKKLNLGESLMIIGPSAFKNCSALEGIDIPNSLYGLGVESFANCTSLPNVKIKSISSVPKQAFQGCTGLKWISLSDEITSLGENSFDGCTGIAYVKSYAEFPPEGLVNFPEEVVANGTLFVPEYSIDYYQYSPTWENWYDFRPLSEDILVSSITLNESTSSIKALESFTLIATVGADDAVNKEVIWRTSNEEVATVSSEGVVEGVAVGEADITAIAADGSGVKAICKVTVIPTLAESIVIDNIQTSLKKGRELELLATVLPNSTTNSNIIWSSSNQSIATVSDAGVVSAVSTGDVVITATAADGSGVETTVTMSIVPPTLGDSNDNDAVTITDAVNTANYAVGNEVADFCFEAADVNKDNNITLSDAAGTVTILLDQPVVNTMLKSRSLTRSVSPEMDCLVIEDFSVVPGVEETVAIKLDNSVDYVALQADIIVPEGISIHSVNIGSRIEESHSLMTKKIDENSVRIALFALDNSTFADSDEAIVELKIKASSVALGDIEANNIIAADAQVNEYMLSAINGQNNGLTGLNNTKVSSDIVVSVENNMITVKNAQGKEVRFITPNGMVIADFIAQSELESRSVENGVYVVVIGNTVTKVVVK